MKIVVVGGSGLIGAKVVATLARAGRAVVAASRRTGFDAVTGEGLAEGLRSASVVVDVSNSPSFEELAGRAYPRLTLQAVGPAQQPRNTSIANSSPPLSDRLDQPSVDDEV